MILCYFINLWKKYKNIKTKTLRELWLEAWQKELRNQLLLEIKHFD
jgi:hypothetical protein